MFSTPPTRRNPPSHWVRSVRAISFSADGALLATGSNDRTVRLWYIVATAAGHSESIAPFVVLSVRPGSFAVFWCLRPWLVLFC